MTNNEIEKIFNTLFPMTNANAQSVNVYYVDANEEKFKNELKICKRK